MLSSKRKKNRKIVGLDREKGPRVPPRGGQNGSGSVKLGSARQGSQVGKPDLQAQKFFEPSQLVQAHETLTSWSKYLQPKPTIDLNPKAAISTRQPSLVPPF